jgi:membrane protease YdiL (CAAX protease family)
MKNSSVAIGLWLLSLLSFTLVTIGLQVSVAQLIVAVVVFSLLMGLYLLFTSSEFTERLQQLARSGSAFGLPGLLWLIFLVLELMAGPGDLLFQLILAGAIFWIPIAMLVLDREALAPFQILFGLGALLVPLGIDAATGASLDATQWALRIGALALPVLLLLFTTREQKNRLSFLFIAAVLFIWFTIEFGNFPGLRLPFDVGSIRFMQLALIVLFLYVLAAVGRLPDLGFTFSLQRSDWREAAINFGLFSIIAVPFGLLTGFIKPSTGLPPLIEIAGRGLAIFLFTALPEEILFRGTIHRYLERVLRWAPRLTLLLSSLIFGAAHLDNPPNVGYYFILAGVAGWFYGRTYLRTGKVVPAAIVHLLVDWLWSVLFAG